MKEEKIIVNSWNEWDPLKHVIVGKADGTCIPAPEPAGQPGRGLLLTGLGRGSLLLLRRQGHHAGHLCRAPGEGGGNVPAGDLRAQRERKGHHRIETGRPTTTSLAS